MLVLLTVKWLFFRGTPPWRTRPATKAGVTVSFNTTPFEQDMWMLARLLLAVALGAAIGYERERAGKPAGLRTHGMVCLGAALFTLVSIFGFGGTGDPTRIAAQVVTGIGFLGAGAILHRHHTVEGLTTAASLWVTAAVGLAIGAGMVFMSMAVTVLVVGLLRFKPRIALPSDEGLRK
jgi:putative Mg2+ transporter-C (MgtC) family protein